MNDKKITVTIVGEVDDDEVKAIDEELRRLKQQRLQLKIDAGKDELEEAEAKIKGLKTFLDNVNHSNTNIHINDDDIEKAEKELEVLESKKLDLQISVANDELAYAKAEEEALNTTAQVDIEVDESAVQTAMNNLSDGLSRAKAGVGELKDAIQEVEQAGMQSEQNKAFLELNLGADKAKQTYQDISDIVASMPGDDNTMRSVLSTAQALGNDLKPDEMKAATKTMADYMAGSATMGKMATESQQDIMKYLLDGNTAELERGSIVSSQVDKLKEANTFMERQAAMQEVLNDLGYGGISTTNTMLNKQAEWEGMLYNSQDALSSMWLGAEKGAMDYILKLNDATNGLAGMGIVAASMAGGPILDTVSGLGQMATGMKAIKDLGMIQYLKDLEIMTKLSAAADWLLSAAQWALDAAMSANPIVIVVLALIALAAALVWAYYNVDWFREAVDNAWATVTAFAQGIINDITNAVNTVASVITGIGDAIEQEMQRAWDAVTGIGAKIRGAIEDMGLGMVLDLLNALGIGSPGYMFDMIEGEMNYMKGAVTGSGLESDISNLGEGMVSGFNPNLSTGNAGLGTGGNNITINIDNVDSEDRIQQIVQAVEDALKFDNLTAGRSV